MNYTRDGGVVHLTHNNLTYCGLLRNVLYVPNEEEVSQSRVVPTCCRCLALSADEIRLGDTVWSFIGPEGLEYRAGILIDTNTMLFKEGDDFVVHKAPVFKTWCDAVAALEGYLLSMGHKVEELSSADLVVLVNRIRAKNPDYFDKLP